MALDPKGFHEILRVEIFKLSKEKKDWVKACSEWELVGIEETETGSCICTHDISWDHIIKNKENGSTTHVGSECINQFGNDSLVKDANEKFKNVKRGKAGLDPIGPCIVCEKSTSRTHNGDFTHKKCERVIDMRIERGERADRMKAYESVLGEILSTHEDEDMEEWDRSFIKSVLSQDNGLTEKQARVLDRILKNYNLSKKKQT